MKPRKQNWQSISSAPRRERILLWTGQKQYVGIWVKDPATDDVKFSIADLPDGSRLIIDATHWDWLGRPPEIKAIVESDVK